MNIGIIGAGFTGLTAACDLTRAGHRVEVYEARPYAGGLAAGFSDPRWEWPLERFYHHWFASDTDAIRLIEELGARNRLFFPRPTTSIYHQGRVYPFDSPLRVLRFTPIPLPDRLRVGLVTLYLRLLRNWRRLEGVTAAEWTRRAVGQRAYDVLWKPLLISKFGPDHYQEVNMAWFWARIAKRTPRLGYFEGGFQGLIDLLVERVTAQGGRVHLAAPVRSVRREGERLRVTLRTGTPVEHDVVIGTCSPEGLRACVPELPASYGAGLLSMGAVVLALALEHPLTAGHYWINLPKGQEMPFMGLVEHTNYIPPERYGGDHLVYCGDYLPPDHPYFEYSKEQLLQTYLPGLLKINPNFRPDWIRASWMFTERYAQPIPTLHHSQNIPPLQTPIPGLWMANMSQVYPWDRGTNYAIELGRRVAREVAG